MTEIIQRRMMARLDGDFVVFLIGAKVNKWWLPHKWLPITRAMGRMLKELGEKPDLGLLAVWGGPQVLIQYWRSFDHLEAYSRDASGEHWPAWQDFNRKLKNARGVVGIWHETYKVSAGQYEAIYSGMPMHGLGAAGELLPADNANQSARERLEGEVQPDKIAAE